MIQVCSYLPEKFTVFNNNNSYIEYCELLALTYVGEPTSKHELESGSLVANVHI